jgi:nucleoside-diphosphate-sugar epimerase
MSNVRVLVTGAGGFVGEALVFRLLRDKEFTPVATLRTSSRLQGLCPTISFDLTRTNTLPALSDIQVVVHAAARVHVMNEAATGALQEFRRINVQGTMALARHAAASGVKRFIFVSSIKVNGENTQPGRPFTADDLPVPVDPYALSKYEAEEELKHLSCATGMELVIVRPPLVYGPGVKANFLSMMQWVQRGVPLPLGAIDNKRSLVSIGNLVDLLVTCVDHPAAAGHTFLVSDGKDVSISQLLRSLAKAFGQSARLLPVPFWLLNLAAGALGKREVSHRLGESLQVDISKNRELLNWTPQISAEKAIRQTVLHYMENNIK